MILPPDLDPELERAARRLIDLLRVHGATISIAESCTGGLLAGTITAVPGSSDVFGTCIVAYANRTKSDVLGVSAHDLERFGAVSAEVASAMAEGVRRLASSDVALSTTGVAGPGGGTEAKPVGLVYIGLCLPSGEAQARELKLGDLDRAEIRARTCLIALQWALDCLEAAAT